MPIPKRARRDENEPEIILALRRAGASVERISMRGVPDLLVGFRGVNYLMEVKTAKGRLDDEQITWHDNWYGQNTIVRTVDDALRIIGAID